MERTVLVSEDGDVSESRPMRDAKRLSFTSVDLMRRAGMLPIYNSLPP